MTDSPSSPFTELATSLLDGFVQAGAPTLSPDGRLVAFVVTRVDHTRNRYVSQVWLAPTDGSRAPAPLTSGDPGESMPAWSPDGRHLAFVSGREGAQGAKKGERTLHVIPVATPGGTRTIAVRKDGLDSPTWSPDGRWIAFTSRVPDERYSAEDESWQSPRRIDTFFTRLNGEDFVFDRPNHVWIVAADGTGAPRDLTPGPRQHHEFAWLADSTGLIVSAARHDDFDRDLSVDLFLVPRHGEISALTERSGIFGSPSVSPDGTRVAFLGHDDATTYPQNVRVGVLDLVTREKRWVSLPLDRTFETTVGNNAPVWESDSTILATAEDAGECHLYRLDASGASAPVAVTSGARCVKTFDATAGVIAAAVTHVTRPAEIHVWSGGHESVITDVSHDYVQRVNPVGWERFAVPVHNETPGIDPHIDAWIMRPRDFDPSRSYPVVLNVHGGPHTQYGETYFDEFQSQAAAGFVVVACNPRGSSGREEAWGQAILGPKHHVRPGTGWGGADLEDVLNVLDTALDRYPFCDRTRVGMQGGSYGGYMATLLAARHEGRLRTVCTERSVNNLLTEEWSSDIGTMFRVEHGPDPVEDPAEYLRMSPSTLAREIDVPVLIVHSENDLRCPINQAEELFVTLRLLGKRVVFYRFPAETHELSRTGSPVHRRQRFEILLEWFTTELT
ncbi:MAG: hypothetical protein RL547_1682 [Actinomycetota bacterium]